jgi:hypothetical protein
MEKEAHEHEHHDHQAEDKLNILFSDNDAHFAVTFRLVGWRARLGRFRQIA